MPRPAARDALRARHADTEVALTYDLQVPDDIHFTGLADLPPHVPVGEGHPFARRAAVAIPASAAGQVARTVIRVRAGLAPDHRVDLTRGY